jgi:hypothetical protein
VPVKDSCSRLVQRERRRTVERVGGVREEVEEDESKEAVVDWEVEEEAEEEESRLSSCNSRTHSQHRSNAHTPSQLSLVALKFVQTVRP